MKKADTKQKKEPKASNSEAVKKRKLGVEIIKCRQLYLMLLPTLIYFIVFYYRPLGSLQIAFKNYNPIRGVADSPWVGFKYFKEFFTSPFAFRVIRNTFTINLRSLCTVFPLTILFALMINEISSRKIKSLVQTASYLPHFISTVVVAGLVVSFLSPTAGIVNIILSKLGFEKQYFLINPNYFQTIYVTMCGWQGIGFGTIIYTSAISSIDETLYEAARLDGAGRFRQIWHITLAGILPTIVLMLIMRLGHMLSVGYEAIILLYQPSTYEKADVISTYVYRRGMVNTDYSFATAVSLFNGVIGLMLVAAANFISRKVTETSLW